MPIHLDSVSRRTFLRTSALFSTAPAFLSAADSSASETTWALLSDTHIAADKALKSRQGTNMAQNLKRVVAEVLAEKDSLSGIIVDGDVAYLDGQAGDYETLSDLLQPLTEAGLPIHFTLGNHDDRTVFFEALNEKSGNSPVESKHCSVVSTPHANWVLLDTLRFVNKVEGEIGEAQLAWLKDFLDQNIDKPAIIVGHHYPQVFRTDVIPSEEKIKISGLIDSEPLLTLLETHPAAKAYIFGHSHNWKVNPDSAKLHQINLPPTAYVFDESRPNGWVRATLSPTNLQLELRALDPSHGQHGDTHELTW
ncbi:MAG: metallophosphoesterase [Verrucomicrobiales bacterium]|nr:metallophosphoesterase [Verrucomicrobiales bacterium]